MFEGLQAVPSNRPKMSTPPSWLCILLSPHLAHVSVQHHLDEERPHLPKVWALHVGEHVAVVRGDRPEKKDFLIGKWKASGKSNFRQIIHSSIKEGGKTEVGNLILIMISPFLQLPLPS